MTHGPGSVHAHEVPLNSRPPVKPPVANEPFKHVIDEYKHAAQTITCTFEATSALAASDLTATVTETTQNGGQAGDPSVVTVTTGVS